jgi:hypothetical protein
MEILLLLQDGAKLERIETGDDEQWFNLLSKVK